MSGLTVRVKMFELWICSETSDMRVRETISHCGFVLRLWALVRMRVYVFGTAVLNETVPAIIQVQSSNCSTYVEYIPIYNLSLTFGRLKLQCI